MLVGVVPMADAVLLLAGCGVREGPLLRAVDGGALLADAGGDASALPGVDGSTGTTSVFAPDVTWQYQLVDDVDPELDAQLFVIDLFNESATLIERLHAQGKIAVAYLSAGTLESYRDDAEDFPEDAVGQPLESYPNESWLDVRSPGVRERMAARLDMARAKGFDGIVPTSLTGYLQDTGFDFDAADQTDYSVWLSAEIRTRGMHVAMSGDFARVAELAPHYDWAVDFGCVARANCDRLAPFKAAGKPVLDVETQGQLAAVCALADGYGVNMIMKREGFGAYRAVCP